MRKGFEMASRIFFRLSDDPNKDHALWTGAITVDKKVSRTEARGAVAKHLCVSKLPQRTLVVRDQELHAGDWTVEEIHAETTPLAAAPTVPRKKKAFADLGMTFDQAEALLKQFGLK